MRTMIFKKLRFHSFSKKNKNELFSAKIFSLLILLVLVGCSSNKNYTKPQIYSSLTKENYEESVGRTPKDSQYTQAPIIERKYPPKVPLEAKEQNLKGTVVMDVEILHNGQVGAVVVTESTGHQILDDCAVEAAKGWRFSPAMNEGTPVSVWVSFPIEFR